MEARSPDDELRGTGPRETRWVDRRVRDSSGELIGMIVDVYDDSSSHLPTWLAISTGFFGARIGVAPIFGASLLGDDVVIAHPREAVDSAPWVDPRVSVLRPDVERLLAHYFPRSRSVPVDQSERSDLRPVTHLHHQHKGTTSP